MPPMRRRRPGSRASSAPTSTPTATRRSRRAALKAESLEKRILLSASWVDADVDVDAADLDAADAEGVDVEAEGSELFEHAVGSDSLGSIETVAADDFTAVEGSWSPDGDSLTGDTHGRGAAVALAGLDGDAPDSYEIGVELNAEQGSGQYQNGFVVFDYNGPDDFKFAGARVGANYWTIGEYDGSWNDLEQLDESIAVGVDYDLNVRVEDGMVRLNVDGVEKVSHDFGSDVGGGQVGVGLENALSHFEGYQVTEIEYDASAGDAVELPLSENFNDGVAQGFGGVEGSWSIEDGALHVSQLNGPGGEPGIGLLDTVAGTPESFDIDVTLTSNDTTGTYWNGFVVFDYNGPDDFKFAGARVGADYWTIGEYDGSSWNDLARLNEVIDTGEALDLHVSVEDGSVSLSANGVEKVSHDFGESVNGGELGLAVDNAASQFDDLSVRNTGLVAHFKLDESGGLDVEDSVGGLEASLENMDGSEWDGERQGLSFDGVDDYVHVETDLAPTLGGSATMSTWIKTDQTGHQKSFYAPSIIGSEQSGGQNDIRWGFIDDDGRIGVGAGNDFGARSAEPINDGEWHHVAFTRDADTGMVSVYVDGELSNTYEGSAGLFDGPIQDIGRTNDFNDARPETAYLKGALDDLRIYGKVLGADEIATLAAADPNPVEVAAPEPVLPPGIGGDPADGGGEASEDAAEDLSALASGNAFPSGQVPDGAPGVAAASAAPGVGVPDAAPGVSPQTPAASVASVGSSHDGEEGSGTARGAALGATGAGAANPTGPALGSNGDAGDPGAFSARFEPVDRGDLAGASTNPGGPDATERAPASFESFGDPDAQAEAAASQTTGDTDEGFLAKLFSLFRVSGGNKASGEVGRSDR